jgi:thymine-DNA glycosylase
MQQLDTGVSRSLDSQSKYFTPGRVKPLPVLIEEELVDLSIGEVGEPHAGGSSGPRSRKRNVLEVSGFSSSPSKKKKTSRPYAPPETYAHLSCLPDYLKDNLDGKLESASRDLILNNLLRSCFLWHKVSRIIDIVHGSPAETSPSVGSSAEGHHYAHPTNHFWKCLSLSGFTGPITASEDHTLPEKYNLGLVSGEYISPRSN